MHFPRQMHFPHWMHFPRQMHFRQQLYFPRQQSLPSLSGVQGPQSLLAGKDAWLAGKARTGQGRPGPAAHGIPSMVGRGFLADSGWDRSWEQFPSGN